MVTSLEGMAPGCFDVPKQMTCQQLETDDSSGDDAGPTLSSVLKNRPIIQQAREHHDLDTIMPRHESRNRQTFMAKKARFAKWLTTHKKIYPTADEKAKRAKLFHGILTNLCFCVLCSNLLSTATEMYINSMNRQHLSYWLGLNHMADWSEAEKAHVRGRLHTPEGYTVPATHTHEDSGLQNAENIDWVAQGAVLPPKDQVNTPSQTSLSLLGS